MINASNDTFIETLPKNDVIMLYDKKGENYIKVFYQLFNNRDLDNCDLQLKEFIYGNIPIPKNYLGTLFLVKKLFLNNQISYECIDIKNGKINEYKFELYSFKEENKFLHKIYSDINNTALKKYKLNNLDDSIKYKSLYYKKRLGDINICFNNSNMFSNLCINGNKIKFKNLLKCIMNYDGFLLKFQILKGSLE